MFLSFPVSRSEISRLGAIEQIRMELRYESNSDIPRRSMVGAAYTEAWRSTRTVATEMAFMIAGIDFIIGEQCGMFTNAEDLHVDSRIEQRFRELRRRQSGTGRDCMEHQAWDSTLPIDNPFIP